MLKNLAPFLLLVALTAVAHAQTQPPIPAQCGGSMMEAFGHGAAPSRPRGRAQPVYETAGFERGKLLRGIAQ
jgi:hypothetical protein